MFEAQLSGIDIHRCSGRKNGCVRMRHPIEKSVRSLGAARRYLAIRDRISIRELAPFDSQKASQAKEQGSKLAYANTPPPTMKLRGAWSLNRNSSPGAKARKFLADGDQKLSSANSGLTRRWSNQSPSVTATTSR